MDIENGKPLNPFENINKLKDSVKYLINTPDIFENHFRKAQEQIEGQVGRSHIGTEFSLSIIESWAGFKFSEAEWKYLPEELKEGFSKMKKELYAKIKSEKISKEQELPDEPDWLWQEGGQVLPPDQIDYSNMPTEKLHKIMGTIDHVLGKKLYDDSDELAGIYRKKEQIGIILANRRSAKPHDQEKGRAL